MSGDKDGPESGVRDVQARQMGTKAHPWRDGNGPAQEGPEQPEAGWQEPIRQGARPPGTSRAAAGYREQKVSGEEAVQLRDLKYRPSLNQVRHEPMPASHHADQPGGAGGERGEQRERSGEDPE